MIFDSWQEQQFGNPNVAELLDLLSKASALDGHHRDQASTSGVTEGTSWPPFAHPVRSHDPSLDSPNLLSDTTDEPIIIIGLAGASIGTGGGFGSGTASGRNLQPRQHGDDGTADTSDPVANPTPCVETTLVTSGATTAAANNAALAASNAIAALNDEAYEYSSIVYFSNGSTGFTTPWTNNLDDEVNWVGGLARVPDGAVIIGIVHNHPDEGIMPSTYPSPNDWTSYGQLVNFNSDSDPTNLPRGITVDPNLLLYIYSNEDSKTHVYDSTDKNETATSCSL